MYRRLRGLVWTAVTWATAWSLGGGAALAALSYVSLSRLSPPPRLLLLIFSNGALCFGALGLLAGASFAVVVSIRERRATFADLTYRRMLGGGVLAGSVMAVTFLGLASLATAHLRWSPSFIAVSAALGGASAIIMLRLARGARDESTNDSLGSGKASSPTGLDQRAVRGRDHLANDCSRQPSFCWRAARALL